MHSSLVKFFVLIVDVVTCWGVSPVCVLDSATTTPSMSVCTAVCHFRDGIINSDLPIFGYCVRHLLRLSTDRSPRAKV